MAPNYSSPTSDRVQRAFSVAAAILGSSAVALGAFGTHALRDVLADRAMVTFNTAVRYQLIHAVLLLVVAQLTTSFPSKWIGRSGYLIAVGIILFSGSLYLLILTGWSFVGPITPVGGACLIAGWLFLIPAAMEARKG